MSFVKTKLALEQMSAGEILEVYLDAGEVLEDVREAVMEEGHQIVSESSEKGFGQLTIRKK